MKFTIAAAFLTIGSAVAAPVIGSTKAITGTLSTAMTTVTTIKTTVEGELSTITGLIQVGGLTQEVVPKVAASLKVIETTLGGATKTVIPMLSNLSLPLVGDDLQLVGSLVSEFQTVVQGVQTTLTGLVSTGEAEVLALIKPEVQLVLGTVLPIVGPLAQFALSAVAGITDAPELVSQIVGSVSGLTSLANGLLSPLGSVLGLLGGL
ncbi:hypothetical protein GQ53DRAFT_759640 [Thozetella sp. PMI_491]|nr:hypothetical protein GQ53DRAFT_759640 [Thozetella sp. PMI_491]